MEWTREEAFDFLKELYDDQIMQQEKRRVFKMLHRQLYERLDDLQSIKQSLRKRRDSYIFLKNLRLCQVTTFFSRCVICF